MARIPTRFDLSMTPAGRFLQLQQPQTPRPQSQVIARDALGRISAAGPRLPSAGPQPSPLPPFGLRKGVMDRLAGTQPTMGSVSPPPPPKKPMSFMDRISPELGTPASAGLGAAAAKGLQLSGYSEVPVTTAQGLGAMMQSGMEAYTAEKKAQAAAELAKQQRDTDIRLKMMEIAATQGKQATKEGLDTARLRRDLRKDFNDTSKYYGEAKQFWTDVVNYSKPEQSSAADLALVFSYMKMLDPDSVVREGEQMQVRGLGGIGAEARGLLSRLGIGVEGTYEGGMLIIDPTVRADIRKAAAVRFADLTQGQADLEAFTKEEGARAGLTPDFFKSYTSGTGTIKKPFVVNSLDELPSSAKTGDYAIVNGIFQQVSEVS